MPILAAEPNYYPQQLFDADDQIQAPGASWWALHTRARQEKTLARRLFAERISFYLPLLTHPVRVRTRTLTSYLPLFPGYLFLHADAESYLAAQMTNLIVQPLEVKDQARLWQDLRQVQRLLASAANVRPEESLPPGTPVEIRTGPLAGMRGKVIRTMGQLRFVVEIDFIQRGASVELDQVELARLT